MKRVFAVLFVAALFVLVVAVAPTLAHCGKDHDQLTMVVAQLLLPKEEALANDIAIREERCQEASQKLDEMILELTSTDQEAMGEEAKVLELYGGAEAMQSKDFRVENGRMDSIAPGRLQISK